MFKAALLSLFAGLAIASPSAVHARDALPVLHNGQNITWDYKDVFLDETSRFGMGLLRSNAALPPTVVADGWEGPVVLNILDQDVIPATYVLQYPFFQNGSTYTAQLFEYNANTLAVTVPQVRSTTFVWVNQPGQNI
ncbi:hypothetical protein MIND_00452800 [Mycena indigotica]|uniref:Uncharacterized protein n=1 Tax=Mycena indigotica TaxID=2126181 RepID=A0A8H6W5J9_9AGAR|nr:uncharacterized protein MIND_00452800 [Mycena indigotica]KAF7306614.1 hypothetical protein MIND_00452800 [Mycena indigotica]